MSARYFDLIREMKQNTYNGRTHLVEGAKERGIKPTARLFAYTAPTVRKWLRRFQQQGLSGLLDHSRARHHQAHETPSATEAQLVQLRNTLPTFGARRLIREFDLPISHAALERIWREHGLIRKRRRKYQRNQNVEMAPPIQRVQGNLAYATRGVARPICSPIKLFKAGHLPDIAVALAHASIRIWPTPAMPGPTRLPRRR